MFYFCGDCYCRPEVLGSFFIGSAVVGGLSRPTLPVTAWGSFWSCEHLTQALLGDRRFLPSPLLSVSLLLSVLVLGDVAAAGRSWWGQ